MNDWKAILSSDVAKNYLAAEELKILQQKKAAKPLNESQIFADFDKLKEQIKTSPQLLNTFRSWKNAFINNESEIKKNPKLAQALMLIDLDDEDE